MWSLPGRGHAEHQIMHRALSWVNITLAEWVMLIQDQTTLMSQMLYELPFPSQQKSGSIQLKEETAHCRQLWSLSTHSWADLESVDMKLYTRRTVRICKRFSGTESTVSKFTFYLFTKVAAIIIALAAGWHQYSSISLWMWWSPAF